MVRVEGIDVCTLALILFRKTELGDEDILILSDSAMDVGQVVLCKDIVCV